MIQLAMNSFITGDLRAIKARTQPIDLIIDFPPAFIQRVSQRRIDTPQLLLQIVKFLAERLSCVLKRRRCFLTKIIRHDARGDKIGALKKVLKANTVSFKGSPGVLLDKRQTGARQNWSYGAIKNSI